MLNILYGGDSTEVRREIIARAKMSSLQEKKVYIVVPEQFSFESERILYNSLPGLARKNIEVVSFTSLANQVFRKYGGIAGNYLEESGKFIFMSIALSQLSDRMKVYSRHADDPSMAASMINIVEELKYASITPEAIEGILSFLPDEGLRSKLYDISLIYTAYQTLVDRSYIDPSDNLTRASKLIETDDYFCNCDVYFNSYSDFTGVQMDMIERIMQQADNLTFGFCCYEINDEEDGVFSAISRCVSRLYRMADKTESESRSPILISQSEKIHELVFVQENLMSSTGVISEVEPTELELVKAQGKYSEMEFIAFRIDKLVREENYRYKDIAVIVRNTENYKSEIRSIFKKHKIPYFLDDRQEASAKSLFNFLKSAVECVVKGFRTEDVIRFLKTGLTSLTIDEESQLENYCFVWNINGSAWLSRFEKNPSGLGIPLTDADKNDLIDINRNREVLLSPLVRLRKRLNESVGELSVRALYEFLTDSGALGKMKEKIGELDPISDFEQINDLSLQYDLIIRLLDQMHFSLKETRVKPELFLRLLTGVMDRTDFASIPTTLDQVDVGSADRIRSGELKAVFVAGVNEGEFPNENAEGPLLSELDRKQLEAQGLLLRENDPFNREIYHAYRAVTSSKCKVIMTYRLSDLDGTERYPSILVESVKELFPRLQAKEAKDISLESAVLNYESAVDYIAKNFNKDYTLVPALEQVLNEDPYYKNKIDTLKNTKERPDFFIRDREVNNKLFGQEVKLSASQIERYYQCRFYYYCTYVLRLRPIKKADITPDLSGILIHYVLEKMMSQLGINELLNADQDKLKTIIKNILYGYIRENFSGLNDDNARIRYLISRTESTLLKLANHIQREFQNSEFTPNDFELSIGRDSDKVGSVELMTAEGIQILVEGKIDRVDMMEKNGKKYIRIVDYKSGNKIFSLTDVYYGISLQMLIYLFAIWEKGKGKYEGAIPAGILYMPAKDETIKLERNRTAQEIKEESDKMMQMNGLILDEEEVISGMDRSGSGFFIPQKSKNGLSESFASLEDLATIKNHIEKLISEMVVTLKEGDVRAIPRGQTKKMPCEFCDYRSICGYHEDIETEEYKKMKSRDVLVLMEEGALHE